MVVLDFTELAASRGLMVPSPVHAAVTVKLVPDVGSGEKEQPVAVPTLVKLDEESSATDMLKLSVKVTAPLVGLTTVEPNCETVGGRL
jgi:hypothetical protein